MSLCQECANELENGTKHTCDRDRLLRMQFERLDEENRSLKKRIKIISDEYQKEIDELREEVRYDRNQAAHWRANHDNMCAINAALRQRPDLQQTQIDSSKRVIKLIEERDWLLAQLKRADAIAYEATRHPICEDRRLELVVEFHEHISNRNKEDCASVVQGIEARILQPVTRSHEGFLDDGAKALRRSKPRTVAEPQPAHPSIPKTVLLPLVTSQELAPDSEPFV